ncbi:MAG: O-antigen ligase family protein [Clostridia bacterium]|nr:O-antigen ligase family protein [Clostridia bacterium]
MKNGKKGFGGFFQNSVIFSALSRFADWVTKAFQSSAFGALLTSYDKTEELCQKSCIINFIRSLFGFDGRGAKNKRKIASKIENSFFARITKKLLNILGGAYLSVYGMFFLAFSVYTFLAGIIKLVALRQTDISVLYFLIPLVCAPVSVIMLCAGNRRMVDVLANGKISGLILFSLFGLRRESFKCEQTGGGRKNVSFIIGSVMGVATYFVSPFIVLLLPVVLLLACCFGVSPEAALVLTLFSVPLLIVSGHPSILLAFMLIYITACYLLKAIRGKRYVRFEAVDFFILLFLTVFASGALGTFAGLDVSLPLYICLASGYFLCANMLTPRVWLKRGVIALLSGGLLSSLLAIYQYLSGNVETVWLDTENFSSIAGRAVSFFENPNMLGEYAMMLLPVAFALMLSASKKSERGAWLFVFGSTLLCLVFTWARGAWLGAIAAFIIFAVFYTKKTIPFMLLCLLIVPFLPVVLPESIVTRLTSIGDMTDSSTSYRFYVYKAALAMCADFFLTGIGAGGKNFSEVYVSYSFSGVERTHHAHNLYMQLLIELGAIGIILFIVAMLVYIQSCVSSLKKEKDTFLRALSLACATGVFAVLVQGLTDYVWYNYRVYFVFFALMGIGVAARRCGERVRERETIVLADSPTSAQIEFVPVAKKDPVSETTPKTEEEITEI